MGYKSKDSPMRERQHKAKRKQEVTRGEHTVGYVFKGLGERDI